GFLRELESGAISDDFRRRCAVAVFEKTSRYDATIAKFLGARRAPLPVASIAPVASVGAHSVPLALRYGENPQQSATFHGRSFTQLHGQGLLYHTLLALAAAMRLAHAFREPAAAVIKHTNPCGVAR